MNSLSLDYETYSEVDITEVGGWAYAMHPSTEILVICWDFDGKKGKWEYDQSEPEDLHYYLRNTDVVLRAYNANFERAITEYVGCRQLGLPVPEAKRWRCTQGLSYMCGFPGSLAKSANVLNAADQKDKDGERLIKLFSMPRKATKADARTRIYPKDAPEDYAKFVEYCAQDVRAEMAVLAALPIHDYPPGHHPAWTADSEINRRGILIDVPMAEGAVKIATKAGVKCNARLKKLTGGAIETTGQLKEIKNFCAKHGETFESLDADAIEGAMKRKDLPKIVRDVIQCRADNSQTSTAKYTAALRAMGPDHRVRGAFQFHGAHTGRPGGRIVQFQNLPRPSEDLETGKMSNVGPELPAIRKGCYDTIQVIYGSAMEALRNSVRHMVIAPPGKTLLVSDWNAVEARILGWLSGDPIYLDAFLTGKDLYKLMAARIFGCSYEEVTKLQRDFGKKCILGLGYSMWEDTFIETCRNDGIPEEQASDELIRKATGDYRRTFKAIPAYWKACERSMVQAVRERKQVQLGVVTFGMYRGHAYIKLPSGRCLWYPEISVKRVPTKYGEKDEITFSHEIKKGGDKENWWVRTKTYGGKICENIDQAICADLMNAALVDLEEHPILDTVIHVYDEIVCEAPTGTAPLVLEQVMLTMRPWAKGLPLKAEAFATPYYRKG